MSRSRISALRVSAGTSDNSPIIHCSFAFAMTPNIEAPALVIRAFIALRSSGDGSANDEFLLDQLVDQTRHIAVGDHHALRQFAEPQPIRLALELGEKVELGQRDVEGSTQVATDLGRDQSGGRQQAQPEAKLRFVPALLVGQDAFRVDRLDAVVQWRAPFFE